MASPWALHQPRIRKAPKNRDPKRRLFPAWARLAAMGTGKPPQTGK